MHHPAFPDGITRERLLEWYRSGRARTRSLFDRVVPEAYYDRPIPLRNPIVFYEGHLPGFAVNTLVKLALGRKGVDERLETLFARGIDPEDEAAVRSPTELWPSREETQAFGQACDELVEDVLQHATLGADPAHFGWDNEFPRHTVPVPAFTIDAYNVTNGDYLEYMNATGASAPYFWLRRDGEWYWRGMFEAVPLNHDAPVYVTHDEAEQYARWKGKRLPTEAEWHRAAEGAIEGHFDFASFDPVSVGQYAPSAWGVYDLAGNGWEWTSTLFDGYPGFQPMPSYPQYSADFFDDAHYVMKGASPVTARQLVRPSFRNWFRPNYPYVYATFRCVS